MEITRPPFNSLAVAKKDNRLLFHSMQNYETRNESTIKQIQHADYLYNFDDFNWILINIDDASIGNHYEGMKVFSYSTPDNDYSHVCPDFLIDSWPQVQINDYQSEIYKISKLGDMTPETDLLGWRGAMTHHNRFHLLKYIDKTLYDIEQIDWIRSTPEKLTCHNYVSLPDSIKKWRYLIDVEGRGYSARVKTFLFSKRVLFLQSRPHKEWYYEHMIPWKHYVPVQPDLSDLEENLKIIKTNPQLEDMIRMSAYEFAINNIQRKHALERWKQLLENVNNI